MLLLFMSYLSPGVGKNGENKRNLSVKHFKMDAIHDKNLILSLSNEQHITLSRKEIKIKGISWAMKSVVKTSAYIF